MSISINKEIHVKIHLKSQITHYQESIHYLMSKARKGLKIVVGSLPNLIQ